ncbi:hypothetical protein JHK87_044572 [Glycine soja]|nr:hypothetical protein JHK87_044572 [Glycine soja]
MDALDNVGKEEGTVTESDDNGDLDVEVDVVGQWGSFLPFSCAFPIHSCGIVRHAGIQDYGSAVCIVRGDDAAVVGNWLVVLGAMMVFEGGVLWLGVFCGEGGIWGLGLVVVEWWRRWWWDLGVAMFVLEGDPNKWQIYDIYDMEGLTFGLELGPKLNGAEEIKAELQRLKRMRMGESGSAFSTLQYNSSQYSQLSKRIVVMIGRNLAVNGEEGDGAASVAFRHQLLKVRHNVSSHSTATMGISILDE